MTNVAREVFFLLGKRGTLLHWDIGTSAVALPDVRSRWEAIWSHRSRLVELAHSHPVGPLAFSREDETTMHALATALAAPLTFSVIAPSGMIRRRVAPTGASLREGIVRREPRWTMFLRLASGMPNP